MLSFYKYLFLPSSYISLPFFYVNLCCYILVSIILSISLYLSSYINHTFYIPITIFLIIFIYLYFLDIFLSIFYSYYLFSLLSYCGIYFVLFEIYIYYSYLILYTIFLCICTVGKIIATIKRRNNFCFPLKMVIFPILRKQYWTFLYLVIALPNLR